MAKDKEESGQQDTKERGIYQQRIADLISNFYVTAFSMDYILNPTDAAKELIDVINDPAEPTEKEKQLKQLFEVVNSFEAQEEKRLEVYFKSKYTQAMRLLQPLKGICKDPADIPENYIVSKSDFEKYSKPRDIGITIKEQAVLCFFAANPRISPISEKPLTDEQKTELIETYHRLDAFYKDQTDGNGNFEGTGILNRFIEYDNPEPETAEEISARLPLLQSINPMAHTVPNNTLMNALQQKESINTGAFDMVVSNAKGKRKEITAYTIIDFDPGETGIKITDTKLSEYERQVSDAIISLWVEAAEKGVPAILSPDMIYRAMPGGSDKASPQQKQLIIDTIEKFRHLHIYVDATEEMRKRGVIDEKTSYIFDENYLNIRRHTVKSKNGTLQGYEVLSQPIILSYCKLTKQLLTIPAKLLEVRKVKGTDSKKTAGELLPMTPARQAMTGYIYRRIAVMKRDTEAAKERKRAADRRRNKKATEEKPLKAYKEQSNTISFETLFADAGLQDQDKTEAKRNRDFIFQVLDYATLCGYIKGYEKQTRGRSITGVMVLF